MAPIDRHADVPPGDTDPDHPETTTRRPRQGATRVPTRGERAPVTAPRHARPARRADAWPATIALYLAVLTVAMMAGHACVSWAETAPDDGWRRACIESPTGCP